MELPMSRTQTAREESDSDDEELQPGPSQSQGYVFELTNYVKKDAEKNK